jgi:hypothetical protein
MRIATGFALFFVSAATAACGGLGAGIPQVPGAAGGATPTAAAYQVPKESQDALRKQEKMAEERSEQMENEELDRMEKEALKALRQALGKESASPGQPSPNPSSACVRDLRAASYKLRIEPVKDGDGKAVGDGNYLQLVDSFTERLPVLARKSAEGKATPAEQAEMRNGAKYAFKIVDLKLQVTSVSAAAFTSNTRVQTGGIGTMLKVSGMVRSRKLMNMEMSDDDYASVKRSLERSRRAEAIAASTMGMMAAYQAVLNGGKGDPKALDVIAESTLKAFPLKVTVTDQEARDYVKNLGENVAKEKAKYEGWMRKAHGDAKYEKLYKQGIDSMFQQAEQAQSQKSVGEIVTDANKKFMEDRAKCARGEPIDPGSPAAGPGCDAARKAALSGGGAGGGQSNEAMRGLGAAGRGDVAGALDAAGNAAGDGPVKSSLQGIAALQKGDSKGALQAALGMASLVPGGGAIKEGLGLAGKLLGFL